MKHVDHAEALLNSIDAVLLAESELLEALKEAVRYNSLEPYEAEQAYYDFLHIHGLAITDSVQQDGSPLAG